MERGRPIRRKTRKAWDQAGHAHELTFSCFRRLRLLGSDRTREWLLRSLETARSWWRFALWAYVIMPEHVHLLI
jgi:putative transposase